VGVVERLAKGEVTFLVKYEYYTSITNQILPIAYL
jgi:hypothetical protein